MHLGWWHNYVRYCCIILYWIEEVIDQSTIITAPQLMGCRCVHRNEFLLNTRCIAAYGTFFKHPNNVNVCNTCLERYRCVNLINRTNISVQNWFRNTIVFVNCSYFVCLKFILTLNNTINTDTSGSYSATNSIREIMGCFMIIIHTKPQV